jgi:hypothetical protein
VVAYLKNKDLTSEIVRCQESMIVSDTLARMLMLMVSRIALKPNFKYYSFIEDMKADALFQLIKRNDQKGSNDYRPNILKFDISYSQRAGTAPNGFAYATQIIMNVFRRFIKAEGKLAQFRDDGLIAAGQLPSIGRQIADQDNRSSEPIPIKPRLNKVGRKSGGHNRPKST